MRVPRIYTSEPIAEGAITQLDKEASNHLTRVLRLKLNHDVILFNGDGHNYQGKLVEVERNHVKIHITHKNLCNVESPLNIHLIQGVSRGDKMDLTLQKGVELGIASFTPLITERCGVKLDPKRWEKKHLHWQKVIQSACEQCGRTVIPTLNPVLTFEEALPTIGKQTFFLHPEATSVFKSLEDIDTGSAITLWVGPEGGFSDVEVEQVIASDCTPVTLGPRVLRTETAALAAVSAMNTLWGDF